MSVLLRATSVDDSWIDTDLLLRITRESAMPDAQMYAAVQQVMVAFNYIAGLLSGRESFEKAISRELTDEEYTATVTDPVHNGFALIFDVMINEARQHRLDVLADSGRMMTVEDMRNYGLHCNACAWTIILRELHGLMAVQELAYGLDEE
jgi:hypothetical protein